MDSPPIPKFAFALLLVGLGGAHAGQPKPEDKKSSPILEKVRPIEARKDAEGLPLSEGILARVGSSRFRHIDHFLGLMEFSPDGKYLASADSQGISIFDSKNGRLIRHFAVPDKHKPQAMKFLTDGKRIAVASGDWSKIGELAVFDLAEGKELSRKKFECEGQCMVLAIAPDGSRAFVREVPGKVYMWDLSAAKEMWAVPKVSRVMPCSEDGKRVALQVGAAMELRDASTGTRVASYPRPRGKVEYNLLLNNALANDGRLAVASDFGIFILLLEAGKPDPIRTFPASVANGRLRFSEDGRYLVGLGGPTTQVWDTSAPPGKELVAELPQAGAARFSPDGKTLAIDDGGCITLWSAGEWKLLRHSADPPALVNRVWFSVDGKRVLGHAGGRLASWSTDGGATSYHSENAGYLKGFHSEISSDRRVIADTFRSGKPGGERPNIGLRMTNLETGKESRIPFTFLPGNPIRVSSDGQYVSSFLPGEKLGIWDATTGKEKYVHPNVAGQRLYDGIPNANGDGLLRSATQVRNRGRIGKIIVADHAAKTEWEVEPVPVIADQGNVRFFLDGSRLVVQGPFGNNEEDYKLLVWDGRSGRRLMMWEGKLRQHLLSLSFAPDGRCLAIGDKTGKITLFEVATGRERMGLAHRSEIHSTAFDPTGTRLVASSSEAPAYVWHLIPDPGAWKDTNPDALWAKVHSPDAKEAYEAIRLLRGNPVEAVRFLKERVKIPEAPTIEVLDRLLKQLDSSVFAERDRAQQDLSRMSELILPQLRAAREKASVEAAPRIELVIKAANKSRPDQAWQVRVCEALEAISSAEGTQLLKTWGLGTKGAVLTRESQESLERIGKRR